MSETRTTVDVLTYRKTISLARIIESAQQCLHVRRWIDGFMFDGYAQNICTENGGHFPLEDDIRDAYLRVQSGITQYYWPLRELLTETDVENWTTSAAFVID